jgi:hypothetical protein
VRSSEKAGLVFLTILVLAGCESPSDSNAAGDWHLSDEPVLAIGLTDGEAAYQFHQITGVVRLADERVVVADGGSQEIRIFDREGRHLRTLGGAGEGPAEFRSMGSLDHYGEGALLVFDPGGSRVSLFDPDEGFERSWSLESMGRGFFPSAAYSLDDGSILVTHLRGNMPGDPSGVIWNAAPVVRYSATGEPMGEVAELPGDEWFRSDQGQLIDLPFGRKGQAAVHGNTLYIGDAQTFTVRAYDPEGHSLGTVERTIEPRPVTPEDIRRSEAARLEQMSEPEAIERTEALHAQIPYPERMPAYRSLRTDRSGNLWVEGYEPDPNTPSRWTVLAPDGEVLADRVGMPAGFEPHWIEEDFVLGVLRDDLDVEYVHGYRLIR